jgi:hypothetical protein
MTGGSRQCHPELVSGSLILLIFNIIREQM